MSDTFEHENQEGLEGSSAGPETTRSDDLPEVTAVQFPKIGPSDYAPEDDGAIEDIPLEDEPLPEGHIKDIPMDDEPLEDVPILEDDKPVSRGFLYDYVVKMDDVQFRRAQTIFGVVLGAITAACLAIPIRNADGKSGMWNFVIALAIAMWAPRYVEKKIGQRIPVAQKWMLIVLVVGLVAMLLINLLSGNTMLPAAT